MAVAFDAVMPGASGSGAAANTLSWTHTPVGSGVAIVMALAEGHAAGADGTLAVTCGGVSMTQLATVGNNNTNGGRTLLFGIANQTGAKAISITRTGGATIGSLLGGSISYTGADTTSPFGTPVTAFGSSNAPAVTIPGTTAGNMVAGFASIGNSPLSNPATSRWLNNFDTTSAAGCGGMADKAGGGSLTFTWSDGNSDWWGAIAVEIKVPGAGGGTGILVRQMRLRRPALPTRLSRRGHGAIYGR